MLVLWIVGCSGETETKPEKTPEPVESVTPVPVVEATPPPPTDTDTEIGAPPLGDGPWTVKRGDKTVQIASYDEDTNRDNGWLEVAGYGLPWLSATDGDTWEVHVDGVRKLPTCDSDQKCRYIKISGVGQASTPTAKDVEIASPSNAEHSKAYHANGWYKIERGLRPANKPGTPPGEGDWSPVAWMHISAPVNKVVTESLCFNTKTALWAERDDDGSTGTDRAADLKIVRISATDTPPTSKDSCPDGYKESFNSYSITLGA